jgi:hypothetical protein
VGLADKLFLAGDILFILLILLMYFLAFYLVFRSYLAVYFYKTFGNQKEKEKMIKQVYNIYSKRFGIDQEHVKLNLAYSKFGGGTTHGYVKIDNDNKYIDVFIHLDFPLADIIETTIHELVHVEQYQRGDLTRDEENVYWKGTNHTYTPYSKRPWEIEAFDKGKKLADIFVKENNIKRTLMSKVMRAISD